MRNSYPHERALFGAMHGLLRFSFSTSDVWLEPRCIRTSFIFGRFLYTFNTRNQGIVIGLEPSI